MSEATDKIRGNVAKIIENRPTNPHPNNKTPSANVNTTANTTTASNFIRAAATMYRAKTNPSFQMSEKSKDDYNAALQAYAEKHGKPLNDVKKDTTPEDIIKSFARDIQKNSQNSEEATQIIKKDIDSAYKDHPDQPAPTPPALQAAANVPYLTDKQFEEADEKTQEEYLASLDGYEKDRLTELLKNKQQSKTKDEDNAAKLTNDEDNPLPHTEDEKFKIEEGDIIKYLMKEIVLASAAWAGNKAAGMIGTFGFYVAREAWHAYKNREKNNISGSANAQTNQNQNPPLSQPQNQPQTQEQNPKELFDVLTNVSQISSEFKNLFDKYEKGFDLVLTNTLALMQHNAYFDGNKYKYAKTFNSSNNKLAGFSAFNVNEEQKTEWKDLQKAYDKQRLESLNKKLNPEQDSAKQQQITDWFNQVNKSHEEAIKNEKDTVSSPSLPTEFEKALKETNEEISQKIVVSLHNQKLKRQNELFAYMYASYKIVELSINSPSDPRLTQTENLEKLHKQLFEEGSIIFWKAEKRRLNGENIPSRETMIEKMTKLAKDSKEAKENNASFNFPSLDLSYKPKDNQEKQTLLDFAQNTTVIDFYKNELINKKTHIQELQTIFNMNQDHDTRTLLDKIKIQRNSLETEQNNTKIGSFKINELKTKTVGM